MDDNKDSSFDKKRSQVKDSLKKMPRPRSDKEEILRAKEQAKVLRKGAKKKKDSFREPSQ
ncbi:MAG: hypothetical protein ACTSYA_13215 [Candidatus Kariarchaeaceae archaeon]